MEKSVVIVAGGKGLRMGGEIPKQFFLLKGKPVLMRSIERFTDTFPKIKVVLVLPENQVEYWKSLCEKHHFTTRHQIAFGGTTRFHSVKNGLALVNEGLVAVHDAVRPLVSEQTIKACFNEAQKSGNAIPVIPINDSLRKVEYGEPRTKDEQGNTIEKTDHGKQNKLVSRDLFRIVQTPQVFQTTVLKEAFQQGYQDSFTDDASVIEANGISVNLVDGNFENIKITRPSDLKMAEFLLEE